MYEICFNLSVCNYGVGVWTLGGLMIALITSEMY